MLVVPAYNLQYRSAGAPERRSAGMPERRAPARHNVESPMNQGNRLCHSGKAPGWSPALRSITTKRLPNQYNLLRFNTTTGFQPDEVNAAGQFTSREGYAVLTRILQAESQGAYPLA